MKEEEAEIPWPSHYYLDTEEVEGPEGQVLDMSALEETPVRYS